MDNEKPINTQLKDTEKKKPGRPRKKPLKMPLKRDGIAAAPKNPENCMEMIYDMPGMFKKIFALFKSMAVNEICMEFKAKTIDIIALDHLKKSCIKIIINCDNINHYYCKEPIKSYLNPGNMEKIIQVLDKNYITVAFVLKTISSRSVLSIIFKNDMKIDEIREIDLIQASTTVYHTNFDDMDYPIKFAMPGRFFKKFIADISAFSNTLTISKVGKTPLIFKYTSADKTVKSQHIVKSPETIELVSSVSDDDIFSSSIKVNYIKPFSGSLFAAKVKISAHSHKNMIFRVEVDKKTIEILVQTDTVNLK
jgi:hypothetical protein